MFPDNSSVTKWPINSFFYIIQGWHSHLCRIIITTTKYICSHASIKGSSWHIKCTVSVLVHFCIWIFMRQNGRQFHESVARRKLKWQDFYYNSRISSDMQYCNKSLFYTPKTGYKMPSLQGVHFYNNINIMQVFLSI